jgi:hypothetical protein
MQFFLKQDKMDCETVLKEFAKVSLQELTCQYKLQFSDTITAAEGKNEAHLIEEFREEIKTMSATLVQLSYRA